MNMRSTLQEIYARIRGGPLLRELPTIVLLELCPLLKEPGPLKTAYDVRIHYYERLARNEQFLMLIQSIHVVLKDIHGLIDPSKFPEPPKKFSNPDDRNKYAKWQLTAKEMHALLIQRDQWARLGHVTKTGMRDSILCPWFSVIFQYTEALRFISYAVEVGAADEIILRIHCKPLRASVATLQQMLEEPFKRLHIQEFELFHTRIQEPDKLLADESPKGFFELRKATECICEDLLSALDVFETEEWSTLPKIDEVSQEKNVILTEWMGDQPISYKDGLLKIGPHEAKPVPEKEKSEFRRVLLELLVEEYQQAGEGMGIPPPVFTARLREIGLEPKGRALVTAAQDTNSEIEKAFHLKKFIRMRGTSAYIFKKREAAVQETAAKQLHTAV